MKIFFAHKNMTFIEWKYFQLSNFATFRQPYAQFSYPPKIERQRKKVQFGNLARSVIVSTKAIRPASPQAFIRSFKNTLNIPSFKTVLASFFSVLSNHSTVKQKQNNR